MSTPTTPEPDQSSTPEAHDTSDSPTRLAADETAPAAGASATEPARPSGRSPRAPLVVAAVAIVVTLGFFLLSALGTAEQDEGEASATSSQPGSPSAPQATPSTQGQSDAPFPDHARRTDNDPLALGRVDAPVVIVNWSDFQCHYCGVFAKDIAPKLKHYIDDGTVRVEWRDFPYLGPDSLVAARGARAAAKQGKFWEFHDALYSDMAPPNSGALTDARMREIAKALQLDEARFNDDLTSEKLLQDIQRDGREAQDLGISGTPSFLINGQPVQGAQPVEAFDAVIDKALKGAS